MLHYRRITIRNGVSGRSAEVDQFQLFQLYRGLGNHALGVTVIVVAPTVGR